MPLGNQKEFERASRRLLGEIERRLAQCDFNMDPYSRHLLPQALFAAIVPATTRLFGQTVAQMLDAGLRGDRVEEKNSSTPQFGGCTFHRASRANVNEGGSKGRVSPAALETALKRRIEEVYAADYAMLRGVELASATGYQGAAATEITPPKAAG